MIKINGLGWVPLALKLLPATLILIPLTWFFIDRNFWGIGIIISITLFSIISVILMYAFLQINIKLSKQGYSHISKKSIFDYYKGELVYDLNLSSDKHGSLQLELKETSLGFIKFNDALREQFKKIEKNSLNKILKLVLFYSFDIFIIGILYDNQMLNQFSQESISYFIYFLLFMCVINAVTEIYFKFKKEKKFIQTNFNELVDKIDSISADGISFKYK